MFRLTPLGLLGSGTAIGGVLLYNVVKGHYDQKAKRLRQQELQHEIDAASRNSSEVKPAHI